MSSWWLIPALWLVVAVPAALTTGIALRARADTYPPAETDLDVGVVVATTNPRTGRTITRHLASDGYAVVYGPELKLTATYRVPLCGVIHLVLTPHRSGGDHG